MYVNRNNFLVIIALCCICALIFAGCQNKNGDGQGDNDDDNITDDDTSVNDDDSLDDDIAVDDDIAADDDTYTCDSGQFLSFDLTPDRINIPYPYFIFTETDETSPTGRRVNINRQMTTYLDPILKHTRFSLRATNYLDGFGVSTPVWIHASTPPNPAMFPDYEEPSVNDPLFCVVLENEEHPHYGEVWPIDVTYMEDVNLIQIVPHLPFAENTTYACVAQSELCTELCDCYQTPDHLRYVMADQPDPSDPDYAFLEPYRQEFAPYFAKLFDQYDISKWDVANVTFFSTMWLSHDLLDIREQLDEMAQTDPPVVENWEIDNDERMRFYVDSSWEGTYQTVEWRLWGAFIHDEQGDPVPVGRKPVTVRLNIPKKGINGYEPPYPVVIFGHGLLGNRLRVVTIAETLASFGIATIGIDWVYHGDRESGFEIAAPLLAVIQQVLQFTPVMQPQQMRDNFRQGVADIFWLKHLIQGLGELDLAPYDTGGDGIPDLDVSRIMYAGISMGASHGTILAAVDPDIDTYALMSGAANWRTTVMEDELDAIMVDVMNLILDFFDFIFDFDEESCKTIFYQMQLAISDPCDPYAYSNYVIDEPLVPRPNGYINILHQMPAGDTIIGGLGGGELARSLGMTLLRPYIWAIDEVEIADTPFVGPATFQYDTGDHRFMLKRDHVWFNAGHEQLGVFFRSALDYGQATIINPLE